jgi:PQQ-dependent catabolism-associated CXXCW motif protein
MTARAVSRTARAIFLGVLVIGAQTARGQVPEPAGYRMGDYKAPTPDTVAGGAALGTEAAQTLWRAGGAVWIDVLAAPRRPPNLPPQSVWMPLPRRDIPSSLWLPDVGRGVLSPALEQYFRTHLAAATQGRHDAPIVFYCLANCWMSWNAAKRAASWGYRRVYWYRDGTDGWSTAKLPLAEAKPAPGP